jgi:receptor protein-tyrosine kinase
VSPKRLSDTAIAAIIGLLLGIGLVILRNRVRGRIVTSDDVKTTAPEIPFVVAIPPNGSRLRRRSAPTMPSDIGGPLAESYRSITAWLRLMRKTESCSVVLVTSSLASEGKTTGALNLAITLSEAGERVLLIDCDLRHPNMHEVFSISNQVGYSSVIKAAVPAEQAIVHLGTPSRPLDVLPAGPRTSSPTELLLSAEADRVLTRLKPHYDFILIDSSPVLPVSDALTLSRSVDQVLMVVRAGRTTIADFRHGVELLRQFGAPLEGAALVGAKHEPASTYIGYYPAEMRTPKTDDRRKHRDSARAR